MILGPGIEYATVVPMPTWGKSRTFVARRLGFCNRWCRVVWCLTLMSFLSILFRGVARLLLSHTHWVESTYVRLHIYGDWESTNRWCGVVWCLALMTFLSILFRGVARLLPILTLGRIYQRTYTYIQSSPSGMYCLKPKKRRKSMKRDTRVTQ